MELKLGGRVLGDEIIIYLFKALAYSELLWKLREIVLQVIIIHIFWSIFLIFRRKDTTIYLSYIFFVVFFSIYLLVGSSVISVFFIICMLTLLLMLAGLHFCVGLIFMTPSLYSFLSKHHHHRATS
jgi:hypothetical protein